MAPSRSRDRMAAMISSAVAGTLLHVMPLQLNAGEAVAGKEWRQDFDATIGAQTGHNGFPCLRRRPHWIPAPSVAAMTVFIGGKP
jgi:hypothetical protein